MSGASMRILVKNLPEPPLKPTKPMYVKDVQGTAARHLEARPYKPPVVVGAPPKATRGYRKNPRAAIEASARKKSEAKRKRKAEAIRLYRDGLTIAEIAERLGVKPGAVFDYTRTIRETRARDSKNKNDPKIIALYKEGKTYAEIAEAVGMSRPNVAWAIQRLCKHGKLERRTRKWTAH